jgi:DNA topoisomerase VI subunit B
MVKPRKRRTADDLAAGQREISVSEFFAKNRHLLGFDSPLKALLTTVKEGVDNALDACEEAGFLPEVTVTITRQADVEEIEARPVEAFCGFTGEALELDPPDMHVDDSGPTEDGDEGDEDNDAHEGNGASTTGRYAAKPGSGQLTLGLGEDGSEEEETAREAKEAKKRKGRSATSKAENYIVVMEDNGPGIVEKQIGKIFGKLLYGSKFHRLRQSRGQQGIGISAAGMYGQMTTGRPVQILSRTGPRRKAHYTEVAIDTRRNQPEIRASREEEWDQKRGTRVALTLKAKYQRGQRSVDTYLRATALANPHVTLRYRDPTGRWTIYERASKKLPPEPREVKPHPYGVELGVLQQMLKGTDEQKLGGFLMKEFCRVPRRAAEDICERTGLTTKTWISRVTQEDAHHLHAALGEAKLMNPPTDCICPIGEGLLIDSLAREYPEAFLKAITRPPSVYRGNPFQVEVALAYGTGIPADGPATILRFANRVPLLYQSGACAISKSVNSAPWRNYKVDQSRGGPPQGPMLLVVHLASVWVPFTSESKEAVAHYDEILKEVRLAVMDCGRALGRHISHERRHSDALKKRDYIAKYIPKIAEALQGILEFDDAERDATTEVLKEVLDRSRNL